MWFWALCSALSIVFSIHLLYSHSIIYWWLQTKLSSDTKTRTTTRMPPQHPKVKDSHTWALDFTPLPWLFSSSALQSTLLNSSNHTYQARLLMYFFKKKKNESFLISPFPSPPIWNPLPIVVELYLQNISHFYSFIVIFSISTILFQATINLMERTKE